MVYLIGNWICIDAGHVSKNALYSHRPQALYQLKREKSLCLFKNLKLNCSINKYRKIPNLSPGPYIFQRPFLRGLYSEGLIYGGKFGFTNRLG